MKTRIIDIDKNNFSLIPRPANKSFNCQECFYWMGKRDGKEDLNLKKKNWLAKRREKYGSLIKVLLAKNKPIGFAQFGPISEFPTCELFYGEPRGINFWPSEEKSLELPKKGWCITCISIDSQFRRQGLATKIIRHILRNLKKRRIKVVDAYPVKKTKSWNQISTGPLALWEKIGFKIVAKKSNKNKEIQYIVRKRLV